MVASANLYFVYPCRWGIRVVQVFDGELTKFIVPPKYATLDWFERAGLFDLFRSSSVLKFHFGVSDLDFMERYGFRYTTEHSS
jgi:hypothetical protein